MRTVLLDANDQAHGSSLSADVCVVGAGPAGIAMALELQGAGLRILVMEAGDRSETRDAQKMGRGESVGHTYYRLDRTRIRAFAGSSNHWREWSGMRARPLDPLDFEGRPDLGREGWPFNRAALDPHYERAQEICGLGPYDYSTGTWATPGEAEPLPLAGDVAETVLFQVAALGRFPARFEEIAQADEITLVLHANVLEILTDHLGSRTTRVAVAARPGHRFHVEAKVFVLAAGGLENPRLLLASRGAHREGIGNGNDLVGRYFMEHPHVNTGVVVPEAAMPGLALYRRRMTRGTDHIAMLKLTDDALRREGLLSSAWALVATNEVLVSPPGRAILGLKEVGAYRWLIPGTGTRLRSVIANPSASLRVVAHAAGLWRKGTRPLLQLSMMAEQEPNHSSRVTLSNRLDSFGSPKSRLDWRLTDLDLHSIRRTQELLGEALGLAGVGRIEQRFGEGDPPANVAGGYHHMGTTRMHASPARGVVDANCKVHDVSNLYVVGMSAFPTAGYANPTLTVVALAVRLARHLRKELASGVHIATRRQPTDPGATPQSEVIPPSESPTPEQRSHEL